jgi:hypothetical protein
VTVKLPPGEWRDVLADATVSGTFTLADRALLARL